MGRYLPHFILLLSLTLSSIAGADERTTFLISKLGADDFRVRTNAALALGATNDDGAVQPLCTALNDSNETVRIAAAVALKRLARGAAVACVQARKKIETSDSVKLQLDRALAELPSSTPPSGGGGGDDKPRTVAGAKFYISLSSVANSSGRPQSDIDRLVLASIKSKLDSLGTYQLAPRSETPDAAKGVLSARKLKGYYLAIAVDPIADTPAGVRVKVRIAVSTYPGKDLQGEVAPFVTLPGRAGGDKAQEDTYLQALAQKAVEQFSQNFQ